MRFIFCFLAVCIFFQTFSQNLTSGGRLKPEQAIMDVRHYTIALDINIAQQTISGYTTIDINVMQPTRVLLFDLLDSFNIQSVSVNNKKQSFDYSKNLIRINLANELPPGKASVKVAYDGKPHNAKRPPWDDGFTWTKDTLGNPWVAVTAEGTGGKVFFPCKDHPSDEPNEGAELIITVPKGLVVAGPGLLKKVTTKNDRTTYDWNTHYTINNYSIVFNIGKYKVVSREYTTIDGNKVPMQFYVLEQDAGKAEHHLDLLEQYVRVREKYFGEYPWAKEKIGLVETPHLGMEHQTMNAYGNRFRYTKMGDQDFDWLMSHELGHEWWGNKITAKDWADYWIHEGIGSFGDALYLRDVQGEDAYIQRFKQLAPTFKNEKPVVQGKDMDEETAYIPDIYGKGAFFMHTLRYVIGDSIFFPALKEFATSPKYCYDNLVTTEDLQQFFSEKSGIDLQPLFDLFLRTTNKLEIHVQRMPKNVYRINVVNLNMAIPLQVATSNGTETIIAGDKPVSVNSTTLPVIDTNMYYLTKIVIE